MKKLKWIFLPAVLFGIIGSFIFFFASAQTQLPCDSVLIPTLEQFNKDYRLVQAYTFENAEFIYEHMRKFESGEIGGDILTDSFFGDYKSSSNKQEFFTRIQNKVTKEGYSLNVADSTSYTRRYLTKEQLDAWTNCIAKISEDGYVKLVVSGVSDDGFTLKVGWKPQRNTGPSNLNLQVVNGSINKKSNVSFKMTGFRLFNLCQQEAGQESYRDHSEHCREYRFCFG